MINWSKIRGIILVVIILSMIVCFFYFDLINKIMTMNQNGIIMGVFVVVVLILCALVMILLFNELDNIFKKLF